MQLFWEAKRIKQIKWRKTKKSPKKQTMGKALMKLRIRLRSNFRFPTWMYHDFAILHCFRSCFGIIEDPEE